MHPACVHRVRSLPRYQARFTGVTIQWRWTSDTQPIRLTVGCCEESSVRIRCLMNHPQALKILVKVWRGGWWIRASRVDLRAAADNNFSPVRALSHTVHCASYSSWACLVHTSTAPGVNRVHTALVEGTRPRLCCGEDAGIQLPVFMASCISGLGSP